MLDALHGHVDPDLDEVLGITLVDRGSTAPVGARVTTGLTPAGTSS
jgi:hypothetical protein